MSGIWGQGGSPQGYAVSVGHFTHFAFTVNFTHYVKTKPDSVFTVKSRTLMARAGGRARALRAAAIRPLAASAAREGESELRYRATCVFHKPSPPEKP